MKTLFAAFFFSLLFVQAALADRNIYRLEDTAAERRLPIYLVDATDGLTEETGITITGAECRLSKNGAASADCLGSVTANETGVYYYEATTAEIDTLGYVTIRIADAAARKFIATANIVAYDPTSGERFIPARGTAQGATASSIQLAATEAFGDDELNNNTSVHIVSATAGGGQTRCICDYVGATDTATPCENWQTTPTAPILYSLRDAPHCNSLQPTVNGRTLDVATTGEAGLDLGNTVGTLDAAEIGADAITAAKIAAASITNSEFTATPTVVVDFDTATGTIDAAQIGADAITGATIAADSIGASELAADAIGASEIAAAAITNSEFTATVSATVDFDTATGTIGAAQLEADTITNAKIAAGAITNSEFTATPTIGGINAAALADLFDTNSGSTYGAAVGGSVVKEIADNAGGGGGGGDFIITSGTAQTITASPPKMRLDAAATYGNDVLKDHTAVLVLTSSGNTAAAGQVLCIKTNASANDEVTFTRPYKSLPSGTVTYAVIPAPNCNTLSWPQSN